MQADATDPVRSTVAETPPTNYQISTELRCTFEAVDTFAVKNSSSGDKHLQMMHLIPRNGCRTCFFLGGMTHGEPLDKCCYHMQHCSIMNAVFLMHFYSFSPYFFTLSEWMWAKCLWCHWSLRDAALGSDEDQQPSALLRRSSC